MRLRVADGHRHRDVRVEHGEQRDLIRVVEILEKQVERVLAASHGEAVLSQRLRGRILREVRGRREPAEGSHDVAVEEEVIVAESSVELSRDGAVVARHEIEVAVHEHRVQDAQELGL